MSLIASDEEAPPHDAEAGEGEGTDTDAEPRPRKKWMPGMKERPSEKIPEAQRRPAERPEPREPAPKKRPPGPDEEAPGAKPGETPESTVARLGVGFDKTAVRAAIEKRFKVYDERDALPGLTESVLVAYFILGTPEEVQAVYPELLADLRALDPRLIPMLRNEAGETVIVVTRRGREPKPRRALPLVLFVATVITLVLSGALAWVAFEGSAEAMRMFEPRYMGLGALTFAAPLLFILGVQDVARRIAARRHHVRMGFPWFIPVPPLLFFPSVGSFGTLAHPRDPMPDRKALFDIAASGPIAGFLATIPVLFVGFLLTSAAAVPIPDGNDLTLDVAAPDGMEWVADDGAEDDNFTRTGGLEGGYGGPVVVVFGLVDAADHSQGQGSWSFTVRSTGRDGDPLNYTLDAWSFGSDGAVLANLSVNGTMATGNETVYAFESPGGTSRVLAELRFALPDATTVRLGESGAFSVMYDLMGRDADHVIHPMALAGWVGFMIIGISLLPVGRFDGGYAARALLGDRMRYAAYGALGLLVVLSCAFPLWIHLALFILLFVGVRYPPPLNDTTELDRTRQVWGVVLLLLFFASFVFVPAQIPGLDFCLEFFGIHL